MPEPTCNHISLMATAASAAGRPSPREQPVAATDLDLALLRTWIGRRTEQTDVITAGPVRLLAATLDRDDPPPEPGDPLPPLWHWLFHRAAARHSELGRDGHPRRGTFLPPVPLPRRMWAGGRFEFRAPLHVGDTVSRASSVVDVRHRTGRSGPLVFVTVRHELAGRAGAAVVEEQDLVYRAAEGGRDAGRATPPPPGPAAFSRELVADEVLLFRFSALTFNGHRIHYDRPYVTEVEGYPGLVVHGPLLAVLLLDLVRREQPAARIATFTFRAVSPLFDGTPFRLAGNWSADRRIDLWAAGPAGIPAMVATAELA